jgi:hypothetical protein
MRPIPLKLREDMSSDKFYSKCCIANFVIPCSGKIEFHHNLIFAGKQVNENFCILPICKAHHDIEKHTIIKEKLNWIMWSRSSDEQIKEYSKAINYQEVFNRLEKFYGKFKN